MAAEPRTPARPVARGEQAEIAIAVQQIADKATLIVRDEIELAKAEMTEKVTKIARSVGIAAAGGIFIVMGVGILLQGFAWLAWWMLPVPATQFFWGFFLIAVLLFVVGAAAGYGASRIVKATGAPVPAMAMEEAQRVKQTVDEARS